MVTFSLTTATISSASNFTSPCYIKQKNCKNIPFHLKQQRNLVVFAAKDDNKLGNWDQIELKLGQLIGENRELTLAKIKDRKLNHEHHEGKRPKELLAKAPNTSMHPNVILWKATAFEEDNMSSNLSFKPNLSLKLGKEDGKERFSDMILVRNPEVNSTKDVSIQQKCDSNIAQAFGDFNQSRSDLDDTDNTSRNLEINLDPSQDATLQRPPKRLDQSVKENSTIGGRITRIKNMIPNAGTSENLPFLKEREDMDWKRAEDMIKTTGRGVVELINCSTSGFLVSFGSLIGFLPYKNLATKWKFLAFESWLRRKGLDPSTYRKNLGIIGLCDDTSKTETPDPIVDFEKNEGEISPNMKLEYLLTIYDKEKLEYLSTFVGQVIKEANIFREAEREGRIDPEKEKPHGGILDDFFLFPIGLNAKTKLNVGDIVTCCIKKISYFGIFVEVEGVPALIHQREVSWDATLNATSSFKIGQVVKAKVHQLDFLLERIYLSLKEMTPDPLSESLKAVLNYHHHAVLNGRLEADQSENEWADLEFLIKELQQYKGIELVTKGRCLLSPGLTPTFQVYMASMFKNQYTLLARAGDKVQEVVVQTSLSTEEMKHAILMCTKKV